MASFIERIKTWQETRDRAQTMTVATSERLVWADVSNYPLETGRFRETSLSIKNRDCIDMALELQDHGMRPAVLNLADDREAGGAVELGSGAQEESLWRRTALCMTQLQKFYPLHCAAIYSPSVPVMRAAEHDSWRWYDTPRHLHFIACPAIRMPRWVSSEEEPDGDLCVRDKQELSQRLRLILRIAAKKGHDAVVLGAMGCGAWGNPPRAVARVFARVLPEFNGVFREIVVAILHTSRGAGIVQRSFETIFDEVLCNSTSG